MNEDLFVRNGLTIPGHELVEQVSHSGGPGGQHVNKTASRITLRWCPAKSGVLNDTWRARLLKALASRLTKDGEVLVHADSQRSQLQNRENARRRLAELIDAALKVPKVRRATKPTHGSKKRRLAGKKRRSDTKRNRQRPDSD